MLRRKLRDIGPLRRAFHRARGWARERLHSPDAWADLRAVTLDSGARVALDIGAHHGGTVEVMLDELAVDTVHAFEPTAASFALLQSRFGADPRVKLHPVALGDADARRVLHQQSNEQTNSLLSPDRATKVDLGTHFTPAGTSDIECARLDTLLPQLVPQGLVVVKSDIQGAEGLLLDGGQESFRQRIAAFYSEAHLTPVYAGQIDFPTLHRRMLDLGFVLRNVYPCLHDLRGEAVQLDALWIRPTFLRAFA